MNRYLALICAAALAISAPATFAADDAAKDEPKEAGKDVPTPQRVKFVMPKYPAGALARGERALVILEIVIAEDGKVAETKVLHGAPIFGAAAAEAVREWRYEATRVAGRPVRVRLTVPVSFATKLPELLREPGIPELRLGAAPPTPAGVGASGGSAVVQVKIDGNGQVAQAVVRRGESPWAETLLETVKMWRFMEPENGKPLQFDVHADFKGGMTRKVELALTDPRPPEAAEVADAGAGASASTSASTSAGTSTSTSTAPVAADAAPGARTEVPAPGVPTKGPGPGLPAASSPNPPAIPAAPTAPPRATRAPVEVVGGQGPAPATPAPIPENGASSIRDVQLVGSGLPDLVRGRRPVAPPTVRVSGAYGDVTVRFSIDSGGVTAVTGVEGADALKEAAESLVRSWGFRRTAAHRVYAVAQIHYAAEGATAKTTASTGE